MKSVYLSEKGDTESLKSLLQTNKIFVNEKDYYGCTGLHYASQNGHTECVRLLETIKMQVNKNNNN